MLNRLLEYNYSAIFILLFALVLKVLMYYTGQTYSPEYAASLFKIYSVPTLGSGVLSALMTVLMGGLILVISERFAKRSDFSLWLVLIFTIQMSFYSLYPLMVETIAIFLFIICVFLFFRGINNMDKSKSIPDSFNLAFVLALACLFAPHLVYMLPLFWLSRLLVRQTTLRGLLASTLGFITPFLIIDSIIFVFFSDVADFTHRYLLDALQDGGRTFTSTQWSWVQLANIGPIVLLVISLFFTFNKELSMKTLIRKFNQVNAFMLFYLVVVMMFGLLPMHLGMMMIFVPSAYFYSNFQSLTNRRWRNVFMVVMLFSAIISYPVVINNIVEYIILLFTPASA